MATDLPFRAGIGYDIHRLVPGRRLVLGGVTIPFERGLAGHSDGDVLTHAVIDALFGACALADIGRHFPPGDPRFKDASSIALLEEARERARMAGWRPHSLDATVVCERPKLAPFVAAMRHGLAGALRLPLDAVSVKAKTNEGLDAVGQGEAIAAQAIILVVSAPVAPPPVASDGAAGPGAEAR
jgi:2-C-methyl-D-erythritol 2,4-cyclodiphosphate synthase